MFCEVKPFRCISDKRISAVKKSLFPSGCSERWLHECRVAVSPCARVSVFGRIGGRTLFVCHVDPDGKPDAEEAEGEFSNDRLGGDVSWELPSSPSALCVLTVSLKNRRRCSSDWFCVVVGCDSGEVKFFTERGRLLLSEKLNDRPVSAIKCFTGCFASENDELYAIFGDSVCRVNLADLLPVLNRARRQLAKVLAGDESEETSVFDHSFVTKKLNFSGEGTVVDACAVGAQFVNGFDYVLASSVNDDFYKRFGSGTPSNGVVIGVGARPYIGYHVAIEHGYQRIELNDVVWTVANKLKSSLPGWLGGGKPRRSAVSASAPEENMTCVYSIDDLFRNATGVVSSPNRRILAITDSFGRIALFDARRDIVFRIFKGYRNGQCGFLEVNENESKKTKTNTRKTLFLVIYVGKRGLLEVWPIQGTRTAVFKTTLHCQLIYNSYGIIYDEYQPTKRYSHGSLLLLLDPDGRLKEVSVPFHFSMDYENSSRVKDVHIVKKLRQFIKEKNPSADEVEIEIINTVRELKTTDVKMYLLQMILSNEKICLGVILKCIEIFGNNENPDEEYNKLLTLCHNLKALLNVFIFIHDDISKSDIQSGSDDNAYTLFLSEDQNKKFEMLLNYAASLQQKRINVVQKVTFQDDVRHAHADFVACFDIHSSDKHLVIKPESSLETLTYISQTIFNNYVSGKLNWKKTWPALSQYKTLSNHDLMKLLILYFTNIPIQDIENGKIICFGRILYEMCEIIGFNSISKGYNETSPWWHFIREVLIDASCPFRSMICAEVCRTIAIEIEKQIDNDQSGIDESTWENMSKDQAQWGLLIGKLDDISLLSIVVSQRQEHVNEISKLSIEIPEINLKYIYANGKGSISEVVAKWLCVAGVAPKTVFANLEFETDDHTNKHNLTDKMLSIHDKLIVLKKQFPFSLNSDSIIAHMCWEYSKHWFKNIQDVHYLSTVVDCLNLITNISLRCGICFMIWSTHLAITFETAFKLISKVGRLPKERLCKQDLQMSDGQLLRFLETTSEILNIYLCACLSMDENVNALKFEPIWDNDVPALTELAMQNCQTNVDVLQIHYQLATALYYQCYLGCAFVKHLNYLFDVQSQKCMFTSFRSNEVILVHGAVDSRVTEQREQFLKALVNKCKDLKIERYIMLEKILDLARIWRIDCDVIKRLHIINLFCQGLDDEAEEALLHITNLEPLYEFLLVVAAKRFKNIYENSENTAETIAILPPQLTTYLDSLDEEVVVVESSIQSTIKILELILSNNKKSNIVKIANMLYTALFDLQKYMH